ncbi:thermonuclease family protein, partial [Chloroflexota bacterium]
TFRTAKKNWIHLAHYDAPEEGEPDYIKAKRLLSSLILNKIIVYEQVGTSYTRIVADVWLDDDGINDIMIDSGYKKEP